MQACTSRREEQDSSTFSIRCERKGISQESSLPIRMKSISGVMAERVLQISSTARLVYESNNICFPHDRRLPPYRVEHGKSFRCRRTYQKKIIFSSWAFRVIREKSSRATAMRGSKKKRQTPAVAGITTGLEAILVGRKKGRKSQIHTAERSIHIIMLDGITTVGRKHGSILLRSTKPDTDIPVGDSLNISL